MTEALEDRTAQVEHKRILTLASDALDKELDINQGIVSGISAFFLASSFVSRNDFSIFTAETLRAHSSIQALEWVPYVRHSEREVYRQKAIQDGLHDFEIRKPDPQGQMLRAPEQAEYFPVFYIEPLDKNRTALGFDLASSEKRLASLLHARKTMQPQATAAINLVQGPGEQKGFLLIHPIIADDNDQTNIAQTFNGFALGVFRISNLFESATAPLSKLLEPLALELTDITEEENIVRLHASSNMLKPDLYNSKWHASQDISFANRTWRLSTIATPAFRTQYASNTHWLVLITGCVLSLLISFYLRTLMRREAEVRRLVKQRTRELQSSERMSRTILENAADAVITINGEGTVQLFNTTAETMFGYASSEVVGQNVKMLMPEPYRSEHDDYLHHHQTTGEKRIIGIGREVQGQHKDGSIFPINLSVGEAHYNSHTLFVGTITDLTDLKSKEQSLREFTNRLDLATRAGGIGVWDYNVHTGILNCDDRMYELYGVKRDSISCLYADWHKMLHPDDRKQAEKKVNEAFMGGRHFDAEFRIIRPDGEVRHIQASGLVLYDKAGQGQRMIGVNLDISDRKESEQTMLLAKQAAEDASRQKSAFLNVMSHELRTPLTVILGYLPLLKNIERMPNAEVIAKIADDMDLSGQHLMEMINDVLDISKIEAGQLNLHTEQVQLLPLFKDMQRKFSHPAQQKGIEIKIECDDFSFMVDARRLRQILTNLIGNALKFTPKGSISVHAEHTDEVLSIMVSDTGIGIPEAEQAHIFDTFRQVDDSSTRNAGGSGLGLAITRRLVELHGGTIQLQSTPGVGTSFTFTIKQETDHAEHTSG